MYHAPILTNKFALDVLRITIARYCAFTSIIVILSCNSADCTFRDVAVYENLYDIAYYGATQAMYKIGLFKRYTGR